MRNATRGVCGLKSARLTRPQIDALDTFKPEIDASAARKPEIAALDTVKPDIGATWELNAHGRREGGDRRQGAWFFVSPTLCSYALHKGR